MRSTASATTVLAVLSVLGALAAMSAAGRPAPGETRSAHPLANGSFTTPLNGRRLHYEVHGSGPVLVALTNSWGLSLEALREMYRPLEERLTLVYFDPRGMGGSEPARQGSDLGLAAVREDFQALRRHLKLRKVDVIGWSNGAINLLFLASERPETLSSAIFVHGLASFGPEDLKQLQQDHPGLGQRYAAFMEQAARPDLSSEQKTALLRKLWLDDYFPSLCADPAKGKALIDRVFAHAQLSWAHAVQTNLEAGAFDLRAKLPSIPVRSLVVAGAHDLAPPSKVQELARGLPNARFVVFEGSGHFSPVEEPDVFRQTVFEFLGVAARPTR